MMSKIKGQRGPVLDCHQKLKDIVEHLFPTKSARMTTTERSIDVTSIPPVTIDEILVADRRARDKMAPGPDEEFIRFTLIFSTWNVEDSEKMEFFY